MRKAFGVTLYCRRQRVRKKDGKAPVEVTITTSGQKSSFQLKEAYEPDEFARMRDSKKVNPVKTLCGKVTFDISRLHEHHPFLTASELKERYLSGDPEEKLLNEHVYVFQVCKAYLGTVVKGLPSYRKYEKAFERFRHQYGYHRIEEIGPADIKRYILRLRDVEGFKDGTLRNEYKKVKSLFTYAFQKGIIKAHPFVGVRFQFRDPDPVFLTAGEMEMIRNAELSKPYLQKARRIFLFLAGCGIEYADYASLQLSDVKERNGLLTLEKKRVKTGVPYYTVFVADAPAIFREWKDRGEIEVISDQKLNKYIKEIAQIAGVQKRVCVLTARHTFSTLLVSGELGRMVPIMVLKRVLGHTTVRQSLHYSRLVDDALLKSFEGVDGTK